MLTTKKGLTIRCVVIAIGGVVALLLLYWGFRYMAEEVITVTFDYEDVKDHLSVVEEDGIIYFEFTDFYDKIILTSVVGKDMQNLTHKRDEDAGVCYHYADDSFRLYIYLWDYWFADRHVTFRHSSLAYYPDGKSVSSLRSEGICKDEFGDKTPYIGGFCTGVYYVGKDGTKNLLYSFNEPGEPR